MDVIEIFSFSICLIVALIMAAIGVAQIRSKRPVGFYSGEKPLEERELSDVPMWNKKHGLMWISYGIIILVSYFGGFLIGMATVWCVIPVVGGMILPVFVMIWYHHHLIRLYKI